jgi:hypothetical protein
MGIWRILQQTTFKFTCVFRYTTTAIKLCVMLITDRGGPLDDTLTSLCYTLFKPSYLDLSVGVELGPQAS